MLSDIEVVSMNLAAEYPGMESDRDLFGKPPPELSSKIERSIYNRRRRRLFPYLKGIRSKLSGPLNDDGGHFIVASMPLEVCKLSGNGRSSICRDAAYSSPEQRVLRFAVDTPLRP